MSGRREGIYIYVRYNPIPTSPCLICPDSYSIAFREPADAVKFCVQVRRGWGRAYQGGCMQLGRSSPPLVPVPPSQGSLLCLEAWVIRRAITASISLLPHLPFPPTVPAAVGAAAVAGGPVPGPGPAYNPTAAIKQPSQHW